MDDDAIPQINQLPLQVLSKILSCLEPCERQKASSVCRRWYGVAQDPQLWESLCIHLSGNNDDQFLSGLERRKVPNLKITFGENFFTYWRSRGQVSLPGVLCHRQLVTNVRYLSLKGDFTKDDVILCLQHCENLKVLKLDQHGDGEPSFLGDVHFGNAESLTHALRNLSTVICDVPIWKQEAEISSGFSCFTAVENLHVVTTIPTFDYLEQRNQDLPTGATFIARVLKHEGVVCNLRELDLRWCVLFEWSFKDLVNTPFRGLHTLRFCSCSPKGRDLGILADSPLSLTTLEVVYREEFHAQVRYQAIGNLVAKKPSIQSYKGVMIMYVPLPGESNRDSMDYLELVLADWRSIDELDIVGRSNMDCGVPELSFHRKDSFTALKVYTPSQVTDAAMMALAEHSPSLKALAFEHPHMSGDDVVVIMSVIVDCFHSLTTLVLFACYFELAEARGDQDASWASSISRATQLEVLCLGYSSGVTDDDLVELRLPNLRRLSLANCSEVTDRAVDSITSSSPSLRLLDLSGCSRVTDESIKSIANHLRHLQCLFLINCKEITGGAAGVLSDNCQMLQMMDVSGCDRSFERAMKNQLSAFPYLARLEIGSSMKDHKKVCLSFAELDDNYYI